MSFFDSEWCCLALFLLIPWSCLAPLAVTNIFSPFYLILILSSALISPAVSDTSPLTNLPLRFSSYPSVTRLRALLWRSFLHPVSSCAPSPSVPSWSPSMIISLSPPLRFALAIYTAPVTLKEYGIGWGRGGNDRNAPKLSCLEAFSLRLHLPLTLAPPTVTYWGISASLSFKHSSLFEFCSVTNTSNSLSTWFLQKKIN